MASAASHARERSARGDGRKTVLVVEDDKFVCEVTSQVLERSGYRVRRALSASQARAVLAGHKGKVDLLLCDTVLPDGNGVALSQSLQQAFPGIKVILTSGYPAQGLTAVCGGDCKIQLLAKPYSASSLLTKINSLLPMRGESRGDLRLLHGPPITQGLENLRGNL